MDDMKTAFPTTHNVFDGITISRDIYSLKRPELFQPAYNLGLLSAQKRERHLNGVFAGGSIVARFCLLTRFLLLVLYVSVSMQECPISDSIVGKRANSPAPSHELAGR